MDERFEVAKQIYQQTHEWYKSAENKAQTIIGVLGSFIVFSSGVILANPKDIVVTVGRFDTLMYLSLAIAFSSMIYGIFVAFLCLRSRGLNQKTVLQSHGTIYHVSEMFFFGSHARHESIKLYESLKSLSADDQLKMYSHQIVVLSQNVLRKHKLINKGFLAVFLAIFFLLTTAVCYIAKLN